MKAAFLITLTAIGFADLLFSQGFSVGPMLLLFVALKAQADYAAARFLAQSRIKPVIPKEEPVEAIVSPLPGVKKPKVETFKTEPSKAGPPKNAPDRFTQTLLTITKPFFQRPKFEGRPHEVLGIGENSTTKLILKAFRHWIKRYHPDQAEQLTPALAAQKTRQLTTAKESLLAERKKMRERSAA